MVVTTIWPIRRYVCVLPSLDNNSYSILSCCCYVLIFRGLKLLPIIIFVSVTYWVWYFFICIWFCFEPQCPPLIFLLPRLLPAAYLSFLPAPNSRRLQLPRALNIQSRSHLGCFLLPRKTTDCHIIPPMTSELCWERYNLEEIINLLWLILIATGQTIMRLCGYCN